MAAEQIPGGHQSIALVDISYLFKRNYMAQARDAKPGEAAQKTLDELMGVRESVEHVIVCCDAPPYRRKEIDPNYKALREKPDDAEVSQKKWLLDRLDKAGFQIAKVKGYEADDVIHTLCKNYWWCGDVRIIASDKDCAQCVTETVRMFVPPIGNRPAEIRGPKEIQAKYGVAPADMGLWLALTGDKTDNIPGVPGIGAVKATQLITDCKNLTGIAEALATSDENEKPSAMWKSLATHWDQLVASLKLTTLEEVPLDPAALLERKQAQPIAKEDSMQNGAVTEAEFDPISKAPEGYQAPPLTPPAVAPEDARAKPVAPPNTAIVQHQYGAATEELQPQDLKAARNISTWIHNGQLYPQFASPEAVFTIILRGKELGVGVTTALAGFHMVEGKPYASADLIRSLAERCPECEYFRLVSSSTEEATWETKHRGHPEATSYTYTIAEARAAELVKPTRSGKPSNWQTRPRDMLTKTAGSKLARIVYPGATLGLYCPEEIDQ